MSKKKKKAAKERKRRKTKKIIEGLLDEMITEVEERVNEGDYFNMYKIANSEIDLLVDIDTNNVEMLNGLHSEKVRYEEDFTVVYVRKEKTPELDPWVLYTSMNGPVVDDNYLVSKYVVDDIRSNLSPSDDVYSDTEIAKFYIQNNISVVDTILYIINPDLIKKPVYTEEQEVHNNIRKILDDKNEAFNNRMKEKRSIKKLKENRKILNV